MSGGAVVGGPRGLRLNFRLGEVLTWRCARSCTTRWRSPTRRSARSSTGASASVDQGGKGRRRPTFGPRPSRARPVRLYGGPKKRLHHLAFGAPGDEYQATLESIRRAGVRPGGPAARRLRRRRVAPRSRRQPRHRPRRGSRGAAARPAATPEQPRPHRASGGTRGAPTRGRPPAPRRLGHVLFFTPDVNRQLDFYTRVLGMKLSDRCQSIIAFLRCTTDRHNVAFLTSKGPGFHHASFEVGSVDEIAMGALRMQQAGFEPGWGLGRHIDGLRADKRPRPARSRPAACGARPSRSRPRCRPRTRRGDPALPR